MNHLISQSSRRVRFSRTVRDCVTIAGLLLLLAGCVGNPDKPPGGVPGEAKLITEQRGRLIFNVPDTGAVYIYDEDRRKVVYKSPVRYRDRLVFYPETNRVLLNGSVVSEDESLDETHVHRLYFVKG